MHTYLGDRRGLIDAVQVQIIGRLDTWVGHGLRRARSRDEALRALVHGAFSFVEADRDAWGVLGASGGFDHPALHGVRARWASALDPDDVGDGPARRLGGQVVVGAIVANVGTWVNRGVDPDDAIAALAPLLRGPGPGGPQG